MNAVRKLFTGLFGPVLSTARVTVSSPPGWSFETHPGSGRVVVVIRDPGGGLLHREEIPTGRLDGILGAASRTLRIADESEPTILRLPILARQPDLRLARVD